MPKIHYPWKRFWFPIEKPPELDEHGFLLDPDDEVMRYANPHVLPLESYADIHCLVLLGEPGIGKSTAMSDEITRMKSVLPDHDSQLLVLNLNAIGNEIRLENKLFESPTFTEWLSHEHDLYVFLDSLDEVKLQLPQAMNIISDGLNEYRHSLSRLYIRIACRTADWSKVLQTSLPTLFTGEDYRVVELAPLRAIDVREAASMKGIDPDHFMNTVYAKEATPLASNPITLAFLLAAFRPPDWLSTSKLKLYENGCLELCKEWNPSRVDRSASGGTGQLTATERMAVASRIAAVCLNSRKTIINTAPQDGHIDPLHLTIGELTGWTEPTNGNDIQVSEQAILETLGSAVFTGCGHDLFTFIHKTYAEFLSSRYYQKNNTGPERIKSLLTHPDDPEHRIIPELYEVAAWTASWNTEIIQFIASHDPRVLLSADPVEFTDEIKQIILETYLQQIEDGTDKPEHDQWHFYSKLSFQSIAEHLTRWVLDKDVATITRMEAIRFTYHCKALELQDLLCEIALDNEEKVNLRSQAAFGISVIGDDERKARLRTLAEDSLDDDVNDDIKGNALRAVWPGIISTDELIASLSIPKVRHYTGSYGQFVGWELVDHLQDTDLPAVLAWVLRTHDVDDLSFQLLSDEIIIRAWRNLHIPEIFTAFVNILALRFGAYKSLLSQNSTRSKYQAEFDDAEKRRLIITSIAQSDVLYDHVDGHTLRSQWPQLLKSDDIYWLAEQIENDESPANRLRWSELIWSAFRTDDSDHASIVIEIADKVPELKARFFHDLESIELESEQAQELKERYEKYYVSITSYEPPSEGPTQDERIASILQLIDEGEVNAWSHIPIHLAAVNTREQITNLPGADITQLPGWFSASPETQDRIVKAAIKYLQEGHAAPETWLGTRKHSNTDLAPYQALFLLYEHFPASLSSINTATWQKWGAYFLSDVDTNDEDEKAQEFVAEAYSHAPAKIIDALSVIIRSENAQNGSYVKFDRLKLCGDQRMCSALFSLLDEIAGNRSLWRQVLHFIIEHDYQPAIDFVHTYLTPPYAANGRDRELAVVAIVTLIIVQPGAWESIWTSISTDGQFTNDVLVDYISSIRWFHKNVLYEQPEISLAALFIWLATQYPYDNSVRIPDGDDFTTAAGGLKEMRDSILTNLSNRGTRNAILALQYIHEEMPELDFINRYQVTARRAFLDRSRILMIPRDFLQSTKDTQTKMVRSATELQDLVIKKLRVLEQRLQGETPAAPDIWNNDRPQDEEHYTDWVKRHLDIEFDGLNIVCAREVQIRRGEGSGTGEDLDIHVTATTDQGLVKVIIETKCCWSADLKTAMKYQLVDRYLHDNQCQHGIYLVGWFRCGLWDTEDWRAAVNRSMSIDSVTILLDKLAFDLSNDTRVIKSFVMNTALR